jgi:hypothetical protein
MKEEPQMYSPSAGIAETIAMFAYSGRFMLLDIALPSKNAIYKTPLSYCSCCRQSRRGCWYVDECACIFIAAVIFTIYERMPLALHRSLHGYLHFLTLASVDFAIHQQHCTVRVSATKGLHCRSRPHHLVSSTISVKLADAGLIHMHLSGDRTSIQFDIAINPLLASAMKPAVEL